MFDKLEEVRYQGSKDSDYWCIQIVNTCYKIILVNIVVLIVVWAFFYINRVEHNLLNYWLKYIILPTAIMFALNLIASFLMLSFCTLLCIQHKIVAVLLATFIVPVMISTLFTKIKTIRITYLSAQILLIISGFWMSFESNRDFGIWIWVELFVASGLLIASYFLAKILLTHGLDYISNIENMQKNRMDLEEELMLDPLTSLYNRKAYYEYLPKMMQESSLADKELSIAILDIDDFKQVNDIYGHHAGDRVLMRLAAELRKVAHDRIYAFRVGGEEFVLIFKGYKVQDAASICEGILKIMRQTKLPEISNETITFSCGITGMTSEETDPTTLFNEADSALYLAKNTGKNKVLVANEN